jgi:hypothetical protein
MGLVKEICLVIPAVLVAIALLTPSTSGQDLFSMDLTNVSKLLQMSPCWRVQRKILNGYINTVRPVLDAAFPVNVSINFILFNIIDMVECSSSILPSPEKKHKFASNMYVGLLYSPG